MSLELRGLSGGYGAVQVLRDVSLTVADGELVSLIGANGAGKSTLMRAVAGLLGGWTGAVSFEGRSLAGRKPHEIVAAGISLVPEGRRILATLSVEENLLVGGHRRPAADVAASVERVYDTFPVLRERRRLPGSSLSGGQQQMLAIGRALVAKPRLLLLDEPSLGLAPLVIAQIFRWIATLRHERVSVLLVEQNARQALRISDRAYLLESGRILASGSGPSLLDDPVVQRGYLGG